MKYLDNTTDSLGIKGVPGTFCNQIMEAQGISLDALSAPDVSTQVFYENEGSVFGVADEVMQDEDGFLYAQLHELDGGMYLALQESDQDIDNTIEVDGETFTLGEDVSEFDGGYYVPLLTSQPEHEEDDNDYILNVEGMDNRDFVVLPDEDEEHADFIAYLREGEDGLTLVSEDEEYDYAVPVVEAKKKDTGASKGDKGKDKDDPDAKDYENGGDREGDEGAGKDKDDKPDFTTKMRKGDKSKTKPGKLDFVKSK